MVSIADASVIIPHHTLRGMADPCRCDSRARYLPPVGWGTSDKTVGPTYCLVSVHKWGLVMPAPTLRSWLTVSRLTPLPEIPFKIRACSSRAGTCRDEQESGMAVALYGAQVAAS
jgi:hypothetical protein